MYRRTLKFSLVVFFLLIGYQKQSQDWPKYILNSLWVPQEAQGVMYYKLEGSYQVKYRVNICYPATKFIETIVSEMTKYGWKRLDFDFLNPKIPLNHARSAGGMWSHFLDQNGNDISQWIDDWEDPKKNIVRYGFSYQEKARPSENTCSLEVVIIYLPTEVRLQSKKQN